MKFLFPALLVFALATVAQAQVAWTEPAQVDPNQPVKLYVDLNQTSCPNLGVGNPDLYIWTWSPSENLASGGNGTWNASNPLHKMVNEGNNIWSYTFQPSLAAFYNVTPAVAISAGISFLVKRLNGAETGVCSGEAKTEDIHVDLVAAATVDLLPADQVRLSPNPANDQLDLTFAEAVPADHYTVELLDLTGRVALRQAWTGQPLQIGALATGQYLVRITGEAGVWAKRMVKE